MHIDIYNHSKDSGALQVWIGSKEHINEQLAEAYKNNPNMKFVPNIEKLKKENNFIEEQITDTKQV
jgi:hypothetical protein